jgi:beta-glucosidase
MLILSVLGFQTLNFYSATVNQTLGIETSRVQNPEGTDASELMYYKSDYGELNSENLQKLIADTYAESAREEAEGAVLLENRAEALPLSENERSVTLFGHAVAQPLYRSSAAGSKGYNSQYGVTLEDALEQAGFRVNGTLLDAYKASKTSRAAGGFDFVTQEYTEPSLGEENISFYTDELKASWENDYHDAAIVMLSREGAEGVELSLNILDLQQEEKDLLDMIKNSGSFGKIIVLVNSGNPMDLTWLEEYGVDACLWIGEPGQRGFEGVAGILSGQVNPSGRLTDTYAVNMKSAPAVANGSWNYQKWTNLDEVLGATQESPDGFTWYTVQAEGIYVGYKYYETRYEDSVLGQGGADSAAGSTSGGPWKYEDEVLYPFGYGLSYTDFSQSLDSVSENGSGFDVTVTVKNTGSTAGKCVVQIYAQTPYGDYEKKNQVEKSAVQLLNFDKTELLQPGEEQTLVIPCDKYLLASYDRLGAKGYILSEGDYFISVGDNAHDALNNILALKGAEVEGDKEKAFRWTEKFDADTYSVSVTGTRVTNQFEDCDLNHWIDNGVTYLSRSDWGSTFPAGATSVTATGDMIAELTGGYYEKPEDAGSVSDFIQGDRQNIPLAALRGLDYDDPLWEKYLNQLTLDELGSVVSDVTGTAEIPEAGKPAVTVGDGPDGVNLMFSESRYGDGREACCYPAEIVLASTFSRELLENRGSLLAEEAMYLNIPMIWMPGANLHRTPFGGRNFEYYSEDANMTYLCTIPTVTAMESKGLHAGPKHFAANDQENARMGISTFFNEQAFREGSLRGFEGAVTVGNCRAMMHGYNRLGMTWCSYSDSLVRQVLENEWGFRGEQETDATAGQTTEYFSHYTRSLDTGVDSFCLDFGGVGASMVKSAITENDDGHLLAALRKSAHDYLYIMANSILMNGYSPEARIISVTPWWVTLMRVMTGGFGALEVLFILLMLCRNYGKEREASK